MASLRLLAPGPELKPDRSRRVSREWNSVIDPHLAALKDARPACYWLDRPERPEPTPSLAQDAETDLAIVGGGFTGLWAALIAAEASPGRNIVLLEASRIAEGASGRNGVFADPSVTHSLDNGLMHFPDEMAQLTELGDRNFEEMLQALDRHGIEAHYEDAGKLDVATS
ncbi:MAG: FAD-dependent oxidoreductase, partial [Deltaproteobacteria bacterium]|nr:FAD-dependent oxidoreductase [Deltaproteobacteria bacterium]